MELNSPHITVSLPYPQFYTDLEAQLTAEELAKTRLVHWSFKDGAPRDVESAEIDMVVLPFHTTAAETTRQYASTQVLGPALVAARGARLLQAPSIGIEGLKDCVPNGAVLSNAAGVMEQPTAELAVTLLLASVREIRGFIASGDTWANHRTPGLIGSRVLVLGYGGVGKSVGRMLKGFDVEVLYVASRARDQPGEPRVHAVDELGDLFPIVDAVVCTLPLTEATHGLVGATLLGKMRDGATFVNVGRGAVADTEALMAEALSGRLNLALDVTDPEPLPVGHPLWDQSNVVITPHVGGNSDASWQFLAQLLATQVRRLLAGEAPLNLVHGEWSSCTPHH